MKAIVLDDMSFYGNSGEFETIGKVYDCKLEVCINSDTGEMVDIGCDMEYINKTKEIIFIVINGEHIEYDFVVPNGRMKIFKDDIELAHYLIDNHDGFADNIINIYNMFK